MKELFQPDETLKKILPEQKLRPETDYVRSQYVLSCTHAGRHILYNTLTRQGWEPDQPLLPAAELQPLDQPMLPTTKLQIPDQPLLPPARRYTAEEIGRSEDLTTLMRGYFLVPEDKDECAFYEGLSRILRMLKHPKRIRKYTILPTLACNARCVYCYEEGMQQVTMTPETAEQTVQYILRTKAEEAVKIGWFGGEPLLGEALIDRICRRLQDEGVEYVSDMITNGSLLTEDIADKMAGLWKVRRVQISMDGAEQDYIARKQYRTYHDTYRIVMHAVRLLTEHDIPVSVRCNVDEENIAGVPQFLADLSAAVPVKDKVCVYLAPLNAVRLGENDLSMWKQVLQMDPLIRKAGFSPASFGGRSKNFRVNYCMADAGSVVIAPDGTLYACEHCPPESRIGSVSGSGTAEKAAIDFCRTDRTRDMCRKCPFLPDCTSFAACPVQDRHCREKQMMMFEHALAQTLKDRAAEAAEDSALPVC